MILYHATPRKFLQSIKAEGLQPNRSTGKRKAIWLHTASKRAWAILHTQRRHDTDDVVVLTVKVSGRQLTHRWRGLWSFASPITQFEAITHANEFAKSPIKEG